MAAPQYIGQYQTAAWNTATASPYQKTIAVTASAGDILVVSVAMADYVGVGLTMACADGGPLVWVEGPTVAVSAYCRVWSFTATATGNCTITLTGNNDSKHWGAQCQVWRSSDGVGVSLGANGTGDPALTLNGVTANSAIAMLCGDWNGVDTSGGITYSGTAFTELLKFVDGSEYGAAMGYYADAGAAGNKAIGIATPDGLKWSLIGIEVKGTAGGGASIGGALNVHVRKAL